MLSSPPDGSGRLCPEVGASPTECAGGAAPFPGSLPDLGQRVAQVTLSPVVTGLFLTQCLGSNLVLNKCLWGGRANDAPWVITVII